MTEHMVPCLPAHQRRNYECTSKNCLRIASETSHSGQHHDYQTVQQHWKTSSSHRSCLRQSTQTTTASFVAPTSDVLAKVLAAAFTLPAQSLPERVAPSLQKIAGQKYFNHHLHVFITLVYMRVWKHCHDYLKALLTCTSTSPTWWTPIARPEELRLPSPCHQQLWQKKVSCPGIWCYEVDGPFK